MNKWSRPLAIQALLPVAGVLMMSSEFLNLAIQKIRSIAYATNAGSPVASTAISAATLSTPPVSLSKPSPTPSRPASVAGLSQRQRWLEMRDARSVEVSIMKARSGLTTGNRREILASVAK